MNIWDIMILTGVAAIVTAGYRGIRSTRKKNDDCGGSCSGCSSSSCPFRK